MYVYIYNEVAHYYTSVEFENKTLMTILLYYYRYCHGHRQNI
jgi:hypothetical protein